MVPAKVQGCIPETVSKAFRNFKDIPSKITGKEQAVVCVQIVAYLGIEIIEIRDIIIAE